MMRGATHSPTLTATSMSVTGSPALKAMVREVQPHQRQGSALEYIHWLTEYLGSDSEDLAEFMHLLQKRTIKEITLAELIHAVKSLFAKYPPELIDRFRRFLPKNVRPLVDDNPVGSYTPMDVSVRIDDCESDRVAAAAEMARVPSFGSMTMYGGIGRGGGAVVDELDFMVAFKRMAWERFRIEGVLER
ncbi:hypothetical protein BC829DRAFT_403693 [Chytridium lagenaria]|nr:hypothetical protein BC829DRAFT_403693 [Chytridium lagenaria]